MAAKTAPARDLAAEVAFLTRALKVPSLREAAGRLAVVRPPTEPDVQIRCLADYDAALGLDGGTS